MVQEFYKNIMVLPDGLDEAVVEPAYKTAF